MIHARAPRCQPFKPHWIYYGGIEEAPVQKIGPAIERLRKLSRKNPQWPYYFMILLRTLCPTVQLDDWLQAKIWSMHDAWRNGEKIINWIGSQDSGKTGTMAIVSLALGILYPNTCSQYYLFPQKNAAESKTWAQVKKRRREIATRHKSVYCEVDNSRHIVKFVEQTDQTGWARLVCADEVSQLQGTKETSEAMATDDSLFLVWLDESALFPRGGIAVREAFGNIVSQPGFMCLSGANFKNVIEGLDSWLCEPQRVGGYESITEFDYIWPCRMGTVYRFDGLQSPNFHGGDYDYLFGERNIEALKGMGNTEGTPKWFEQARSLPFASQSSNRVIRQIDLNQGRVTDEIVWGSGVKRQCGFLDAGFGGDPAIVTRLVYGERYEREELKPVLAVAEHFTMPVMVHFKADQRFIEMARKVNSREYADIQVGDEVSTERQLAIGLADWAIRRGLPASHIGFDDSLRGDVSIEMARAFGTSVVNVSYTRPSEKVPVFPPAFDPVKKVPILWSDVCRTLTTQTWRVTANIIRAGMFRAGEFERNYCTEAFSQMMGRELKASGSTLDKTKEDIVPKHVFKELYGRSPDNADSLCGAVWLATQLFIQMKVPQQSRGDSGGVMSILAKRMGKGIRMPSMQQPTNESAFLAQFRR